MDRQEPGNSAEPDVTLLRTANFLLRSRRRLFACILVSVVVVTAWALLRRPTYTSNASFVPQSKRTAAAAVGLTAQPGLTVPAAEPSQSPAFYAELVVSEQILAGLAETKYPEAPAGSLLEAEGIAGPTVELRRDAAVRFLKTRVAAAPNSRTGVVAISVRLRDPALAHAVNSRLVELVNEFDVSTRRSQAKAERAFTERRLAEARAELRETEGRREAFLVGNRDFRGSPSLVSQNERLEREVAFRQQVYTTLAQAFELARIEEVRDTPVLTVLEPPTTPVRPDSRRLVTLLILAILVGAVLGIGAGLLAEMMRGASASGTDAYSEFETLWGRATGGLLGKLARRPPGSAGSRSGEVR